jgi:hypothetical protein
MPAPTPLSRKDGETKGTRTLTPHIYSHFLHHPAHIRASAPGAEPLERLLVQVLLPGRWPGPARGRLVARSELFCPLPRSLPAHVLCIGSGLGSHSGDGLALTKCHGGGYTPQYPEGMQRDDVRCRCGCCGSFDRKGLLGQFLSVSFCAHGSP